MIPDGPSSMTLRREDVTGLDGKSAEGASNLRRRGACRGKFAIRLVAARPVPLASPLNSRPTTVIAGNY